VILYRIKLNSIELLARSLTKVKIFYRQFFRTFSKISSLLKTQDFSLNLATAISRYPENYQATSFSVDDHLHGNATLYALSDMHGHGGWLSESKSGAFVLLSIIFLGRNSIEIGHRTCNKQSRKIFNSWKS
jgi:hypothetical protein